MTIDKIYKNREISVRSYHVCKYNELNSIHDLKMYYYENKSFEKLRNCGKKSNEELIEICNNYPDDYIESKEIEVREENPLESIISNFTRVQREVVNSFIVINTNSLSVRSKNGVSMYLNGNFKIKNFAQKILFRENFTVNNIKNIGSKSVPEIELYISIIKDFVKEVNESKDEKYLISLKNSYLIQRTFSSISIVPKNILESESIFLLTDFLLNQNAFFDEIHTTIVKNGLKIYQNQEELTLDEIAEKVNLTRERVRQIRKLCLDNLFNKLLFVQNFNDDIFQKYGIDTMSDQIEINQELVGNIHNNNLTHFSVEFISYLLYVYLSNDFSLIGNSEDVLQARTINSRNRHNWRCFYLIKTDIISEVDFDALVNDIESRLNEKIVDSYDFNFKSYVSRFLKNNDYSILSRSLPIVERIINDEFGLVLDINDNIIFVSFENT